MFSLALEAGVQACMEHHSYSLDGQVRRQEAGGSIGLKLTGALAKVFMVYWCREFQQVLAAATKDIVGFNNHLHGFYVDDHNLAVEELPPGCRFRDGKVVVVPEEVAEDLLLAGDRRTAQVILDCTALHCTALHCATLHCAATATTLPQYTVLLITVQR